MSPRYGVWARVTNDVFWDVQADSFDDAVKQAQEESPLSQDHGWTEFYRVEKQDDE